MAGLAAVTLTGALVAFGLLAPRRSLPQLAAAGVRSGRINVEGDSIYYEVRGHGSPLLLVPGARGDGGYYSRLADVLADRYEVITGLLPGSPVLQGREEWHPWSGVRCARMYSLTVSRGALSLQL